jgi:hypothetical protein
MRNVIIAIFLAVILVGLLYALKIPVIPKIPLTDLNETENETTDLTHLPPPEEEGIIYDIPEHMLDIPPGDITLPCNASEVSYPDYESYYGDYISVDRPDYITESTVDCSLRGRDAEITQDLNEKLAILDDIEDEIEDVEDDADDLLSEGEDALECIREAEHGLEAAGMAGAELARESIGSAFPSATMQTVVLRKLKNFYSTLGYVYTAKSHTDASMDSLDSLVDGLQEHCRIGGCLYPEDKEQYEIWLEGRHGDAVYYAGRTQDFIDDARMYAQGYHDSKGHYITVEKCLEEMVPEHEGVPELINYTNATEGEPAAETELTMPINETMLIPPSDIVKGFKGVHNITYVEEETKYVITTKETRKLLWLFDVDVETVTEVDAEDGSTIAEDSPWWSFLLTD